MSALRAAGLTVRYSGQNASSAALRDITLDIELEQRLLLAGPNGAGKSTLLRVFAGLTRPTSGTVAVMDQPVARARPRVGVVAHATYLYDELTARENLRLYAELYGVLDPPARADELLAQLGLSHLGDQRVGALSRGQQQRVALARAVVHEPQILLLDEPDTGLDRAGIEMLVDLACIPGRTVLVTTHDLAHGAQLADRVAVLAHGQIVHCQPLAAADVSSLGLLLDRLARA
ncbi:MAG: ABC transporter ATP-binding protein [Chloroflexota bacterium]